jgi:hypothetical protein
MEESWALALCWLKQNREAILGESTGEVGDGI